jgi:hypothetical protein
MVERPRAQAGEEDPVAGFLSKYPPVTANMTTVRAYLWIKTEQSVICVRG